MDRWRRRAPRRPRSLWAPVTLLACCAVVAWNVAFFRGSLWRQSPATTASMRTHPELPADQREQLIASLWNAARDCPTPRGIVLPLFDDVALLGVSLVLELREMGVALPIEVPHCGDLDDKLVEQLAQQDHHVRVYDVCVQAAASVDASTGRPLFCSSLADCHRRFRSFDIKILSLVLSRFQQIMLLDADTLFFQNPMPLWDTPKYTATGTLFFHDRISYERDYLAKRVVPGREKRAALHQFLASFDVAPFRSLATIPRPTSALAPLLSSFNLSFQPSEFLLTSHSWTLRAGHQMDSSLVLWHKPRQPRATAILASFIARDLRPTSPPPSYGDKELYFLACELAETAYAFSDHGVGTVGVELLLDSGDGRSVLCGDALHYFPEPTTRGLEPRPLYMNSDHITAWRPTVDKLYRTQARPAWLYPGSGTARGLDQMCPFNVTLVPLMDVELALLTRRQQLVQTADLWAQQSGFLPPNTRGWRHWGG